LLIGCQFFIFSCVDPDGKSNISDRLELVSTFRKSDISEKVLEFYDSKEFMPTDKDLSLIENWLQIINSNLKSSKI